jgi:hypothetical protein
MSSMDVGDVIDEESGERPDFGAPSMVLGSC